MTKFAIDLVNSENGQQSWVFVDINDGFKPGGIRLVRPGHANFEVEVVNPRTNEQRRILVEMTPDQAAAATAAPCLAAFVQSISLPNIPDGFMPLGNGVRPVTLQ